MQSYWDLDEKQRAALTQGEVEGYLVVEFMDGREKHHPVSAEHIRKCMNCAQTQNIWSKWFEQMALKTVLEPSE